MQTLAGIRNRTNEPQVLVHDGESTEFAPKEVRIVDAEMAHHATTRILIRHQKGKDGKVLPALEGVQLFEIVPLDEALKVAKLTENPSIVEARRKAEEKAKERAALIGEITGELKEKGWRPPEDANKGGRK